MGRGNPAGGEAGPRCDRGAGSTMTSWSRAHRTTPHGDEMGLNTLQRSFSMAVSEIPDTHIIVLA